MIDTLKSVKSIGGTQRKRNRVVFCIVISEVHETPSLLYSVGLIVLRVLNHLRVMHNG